MTRSPYTRAYQRQLDEEVARRRAARAKRVRQLRKQRAAAERFFFVHRNPWPQVA